MLRAEGIHKIYKNGKKKLHVLQGIDLKVESAKSVAIVGPSGAGKSTLLYILGGIDRPFKGRVFLNNKDLYALSDTERAWLRNQKIGFVFQFYHLLPEFTALENAMMPGLVRGEGCPSTDPEPVEGSLGTGRVKGEGVREIAERLLEQLGLKDRLQHRPSELSGGEQQRVAIARALVNNPDMLLCDEPTGNLDSKMGQEILDILFGRDMKDSTTIVIVTHDKEIARRADRVLEIRDGVLV